MSQTSFANIFSADFSPANPNEIFNDMPCQEYEFPRGLETPNASSTIPEMSISSNDYDQPTHHSPYSLNNPGQETALSDSLETSFYEPSSSQETSFSCTSTSTSISNSNCFFHDTQNVSEVFACPEQRLSEEFETIHQDSQPTHLTNPSTPSIQALHTSSSNPASPCLSSSSPISPDRHSCPHCPRTFKRLGDVKRHEKVHIPGQRRFHCRQAGCERKGWRGFYRRDKLRDHVKTVHGS
jgi:hypothetical protein